MFSFESVIDLPMIWSGIIGLAVLLYIMLDGFDLGVGILFPFAPSHSCQNKMMNSIAPFWDGNETWLVLGGGGLFAAFPLAYAVIMPAMYVPVILMLLCLIFRGVAFEFRFKADKSQMLWNYAFHFGSLGAAFCQGLILGGLVQGITVEGRSFAGGAFDWLTGFSIMCGIAVIFGYGLLGATWLNLKTDGKTQKWARDAAMYMSFFVVLFLGLVSLWVPFLDTGLYERWFGDLFGFLLPIPLLTALFFVGLFYTLRKKYDGWPFVFAELIFVMAYAGLVVSLYPYAVPYALSFEQTAAAPASLSLMLVGVVIMLPIILAYTLYCYRLFRGKTHDEPMY